MKKKNLLALFLFVLMSVCANQAQAQVAVTADLKLAGVTYGWNEGYWVEDRRTGCLLFENSKTAGLESDGANWGVTVFVMKNKLPADKTIDDVEVLWCGERIKAQKMSTNKYFYPIEIIYDGTFLTEATLVVRWFDPNAIEGVDADNKAVYYADGVVYNRAGEIAIYNLTGKLVLSSNESLVDVSDLANGVYVVRGGNKVVKFVK